MKINEYVDLFIKWIVAFFIPVGWAIILYPLMRKRRKAWPVLLIIAILLSFSMLVIKEIMDKVTPIFDELIAYILGIFFSIAALSLLFNFNSKWLTALPKDDTFFREHKIKGPVHLRHLLQIGILIEDEGRDFYTRLAEKATNVDVKNLCHKLAQDEVRHKNFIENILYRWLPLPIDKQSLALFRQELKDKGIFLNPPPLDSTEEDMLKYAIEQEKKTIDFYLTFEKVFPQAWKRIYVEKLVMEEKAHVNQLVTSYQNFKATQV
jgi:rubrerythrin